MIRLIIISIFVVVVALVTVPLWGSCGLQADICSNWCGVRHINSDIKVAACRAECVTKRLACMAKEGGM